MRDVVPEVQQPPTPDVAEGSQIPESSRDQEDDEQPQCRGNEDSDVGSTTQDVQPSTEIIGKCLSLNLQ